MGIIRRLQRRYAIFCPYCDNELNWFERVFGNDIDRDHLLCVGCNKFFINDTALAETDLPRKRTEHFKQQGWDDEGYQGAPTSHFYQPKWLREIEKFLRKE